jgi:hypothetical protein
MYTSWPVAAMKALGRNMTSIKRWIDYSIVDFISVVIVPAYSKQITALQKMEAAGE